MPLTGEQKKVYQREYMRKRRTGLTGGSNKELNVGASGFEPPTSASRTLRANQAALRPDATDYILTGYVWQRNDR